MGILSRNIELEHAGHQIALSAVMSGWSLSTAIQLKLYIDGKQVDEQSASWWADIVGGTLTLRGQLEPNEGHESLLPVKAEMHLRFWRRSEYNIYVGKEMIHQEYATWQAV